MRSALIVMALFTLAFSHLARADGSPILEAQKEAFEFADDPLKLDHTHAWMVKKTNDEFEVSIIEKRSKTSIAALVIGCHPHDDHFDCEEEGFAEKNVAVGGFDLSIAEFQRVANLSAQRFENQVGLARLNYMKFWKTLREGEGHGGSKEIWSRFNYVEQGKEKDLYDYCHKHGDEFKCHFRSKGKGEFDFEKINEVSTKDEE